MTSLANRTHPLTLDELEKIVKKKLQEKERKKELALFKNEIEDAHVDISPPSVTFQKISVFLENFSKELKNESPATFEGLVVIVSELGQLGFSDNKPIGQVRQFFDGLKAIVNDDWARQIVEDLKSLSVELKFKRKLALCLHHIYNHVHGVHDGKITVIKTPFSQLKDRIDQRLELDTPMEDEQELPVHQQKKRKI